MNHQTDTRELARASEVAIDALGSSDMQNLRMWMLIASLLVGSAACHSDDEDAAPDEIATPRAPRSARQLIEQVQPPVELTKPPADATKTESGLVYKKLVANDRGEHPALGDKALIRYTGWRPRTGETFFTTKSSPIAIDIAHAAPGFREALPLLRKGEKAVLWLPPSASTPEPVVYEVEIVDVISPIAARSR